MSALRPDREQTIEAICVRDAKAAGWDVIKVFKRGYPDRLFFKNRDYVWVEFKRAK